MPAAPATVACYLGILYASGRVRGGSIRPYLGAIGSQHRRCGFVDPTDDPLVQSTRRGYRACDQARVGAPATRSGPLHARCALRALQLALSSEPPAHLQYWGLVALGFLLCSRPTAVRLLERDDVDVQLHAITLQMRIFKGSETGVVPRVAIRIPIPAVPGPAHDPVYRLVARLVAATSPAAPRLFPHATAASVHASVQQLVSSEAPPRGTKYTPRSLRSGGISAAYAEGVGLPAIMRLSNHASATTVHRYYLDALLPASEAGRTFFRRFLSAGAANRGGGSA
jgi:integrase